MTLASSCSKTEKLVKFKNVDNPEEYNPNKGMITKPSVDLILTVYKDGEEKIISCRNIGGFDKSDDEMGKQFLDTCNIIESLIYSTDEWKELPDSGVCYC